MTQLIIQQVGYHKATGTWPLNT